MLCGIDNISNKNSDDALDKWDVPLLMEKSVIWIKWK